MGGTMFRCRLRTSLLPTHSVREGSPSPGLSIDMSKVKIQYEVDGARPVHCWHSCITPHLLATLLSFRVRRPSRCSRQAGFAIADSRSVIVVIDPPAAAPLQHLLFIDIYNRHVTPALVRLSVRSKRQQGRQSAAKVSCVIVSCPLLASTQARITHSARPCL